jgi:hypothetical protein
VLVPGRAKLRQILAESVPAWGTLLGSAGSAGQSYAGRHTPQGAAARDALHPARSTERARPPPGVTFGQIANDPAARCVPYRPAQCAKWRVPVKYMVMPAAVAA